MNRTYFLLLTLFIISLLIRTSYELSKKAGKVNPKSKLLFIAILVTMIVLWMSWFEMCPLDPLKISLPSWTRLTGLGIFIVGLLLALGALFQLRGVENIDHLVTTGLFAIIRHPMYLGFILWIIGWAIYHSAAASFMVGLIGIANVLYWQHLEDNNLVATFGEEYLQYRKSTWL